MAGQAAATLAGADLIPSWGYELWDTSWLFPETRLPGRALHALVGYTDRPMGVQLAAYVAVLIVLLLGGRLVARGSPSGLGPRAARRPWTEGPRNTRGRTDGQFRALSTSLFLLIHGIMARSFSPTSSIGWRRSCGGASP